MIHSDLAVAATALTETAAVLEPAALSDLVPLFACGLVMAHIVFRVHIDAGGGNICVPQVVANRVLLQ